MEKFLEYLELLEKSKNISLSKNFKLYDLIYSKTALDKKIPNIPNEKQIENLKILSENLLEKLNILFGKIKITSGFRSEELNKILGGTENSKHKDGLAVDFIPTNIGIRPAMYMIRNSKIDFDKCILEPTWIHISYSKIKNKKEFYEAIKDYNGNFHYNRFFD